MKMPLNSNIQLSTALCVVLMGISTIPATASELQTLSSHELDLVTAGNANANAKANAQASGRISTAQTSTQTSAKTSKHKYGEISAARASGGALACCESAKAEVKLTVSVSGNNQSSHTSSKVSVNKATGKSYARGYASVISRN